jgi:hypothetical protein
MSRQEEVSDHEAPEEAGELVSLLLTEWQMSCATATAGEFVRKPKKKKAKVEPARYQIVKVPHHGLFQPYNTMWMDPPAPGSALSAYYDNSDEEAKDDSRNDGNDEIEEAKDDSRNDGEPGGGDATITDGEEEMVLDSFLGPKRPVDLPKDAFSEETVLDSFLGPKRPVDLPKDAFSEETVLDSFLGPKRPVDLPKNAFSEPFSNADVGGVVCVKFSPHNVPTGSQAGYHRGEILYAVSGPDAIRDVTRPPHFHHLQLQHGQSGAGQEVADLIIERV